MWITELMLDTAIHKTSRIEILKHLSDRGYEVRLWGISSGKRNLTHHPVVKFLCFPIQSAPLIQICIFSITLFFFLPVYVLAKKPRYVIAEPGAPVLALLWKPLLSSCTNLKVVLDIRSTPVEVRGLRGSLRALIFEISVLVAKSMFDGITTISAGMKNDITRKYRIDSGRVGVWSDGVSTQLFDPAAHSADGVQTRRENHLDKAFIIFYHGAITHKRGIIEAAKSIEMLSGKGYRDVVLFLLGNGPALPALRRLIHEKGLEGRVLLHDVVDYEEVPKYIAMSDVGIIPLPNLSDWRYQCPLNLLEYLSMEKPVIITDIPGNRAIVDASECATYAASADPSELAKAIMHIHRNRTMLKEWGSHGRVIIEQRYDWARVAETLENFLTSR